MAQPHLALRTTRNGLFSHYVVAGSKNPPPLGVGSVNEDHLKRNRNGSMLKKCCCTKRYSCNVQQHFHSALSKFIAYL